uniref:Uncharacterized protein n=1 Tax=Setaria digitata TaxID=48799 RepID=A0A915PUN8_9BILA
MGRNNEGCSTVATFPIKKNFGLLFHTKDVPCRCNRVIWVGFSPPTWPAPLLECREYALTAGMLLGHCLCSVALTGKRIKASTPITTRTQTPPPPQTCPRATLAHNSQATFRLNVNTRNRLRLNRKIRSFELHYADSV